MEIKIESTRMKQARENVEILCEEKGMDLRNRSDWQGILREIDARFDRRIYKCKRCWDTGIIEWVGPDGMMYGRKCGFCRYWDEQREKARREKEARGVKE